MHRLCYTYMVIFFYSAQAALIEKADLGLDYLSSECLRSGRTSLLRFVLGLTKISKQA